MLRLISSLLLAATLSVSVGTVAAAPASADVWAVQAAVNCYWTKTWWISGYNQHLQQAYLPWEVPNYEYQPNWWWASGYNPIIYERSPAGWYKAAYHYIPAGLNGGVYAMGCNP